MLPMLTRTVGLPCITHPRAGRLSVRPILNLSHLDIVRLLVTAGKANVNAQSRSTGYTPLSMWARCQRFNLVVNAASRGHRSVLEFLIALPAIDWSIRNVQNESVYDIAAGKGDLSTCEWIENFERENWLQSNPDGAALDLVLELF